MAGSSAVLSGPSAHDTKGSYREGLYRETHFATVLQRCFLGVGWNGGIHLQQKNQRI